MIIKSIELTTFRNIEGEKIEFSPTVNVIHGANAQGKTNIIEGIYLFARGKSFRAFKDKELIKFDSEVAYALMEYAREDETSKLGVKIAKNSAKSFYKDGNRVARTADVIGEFGRFCFARRTLE